MHETLDDHQQRLLATIREGDRLLRARAPDRAALAAMRWRLVRLLREYQVFKHRRIFDPALASASTAAALQARAMKADCIAAGEAIRRFILTWSGEAGPPDWRGYRFAALELHMQIRRHMLRERRGVAELRAMLG